MRKQAIQSESKHGKVDSKDSNVYLEDFRHKSQESAFSQFQMVLHEDTYTNSAVIKGQMDRSE